MKIRKLQIDKEKNDKIMDKGLKEKIDQGQKDEACKRLNYMTLAEVFRPNN